MILLELKAKYLKQKQANVNSEIQIVRTNKQMFADMKGSVIPSKFLKALLKEDRLLKPESNAIEEIVNFSLSLLTSSVFASCIR